MNIAVYFDIVTIRRKPLALGSSQSTVKQAISQMVSLAITVVAPLPVGVISLITLSIAEALDSSQRVSAFLTGLKDKEADRAGNPFFPLTILVL
jgi:archaellum biogenesis ATPase FlaH